MREEEFGKSLPVRLQPSTWTCLEKAKSHLDRTDSSSIYNSVAKPAGYGKEIPGKASWI
jgi:hypothetical protein